MNLQSLLLLLILGSAAIMCPVVWLLPQSNMPSDQGTLDIDINYTGSWYRETFNYARDAENIRHVILVRSANEVADPDEAGWAFTSLVPQEDGSWVIREDRQEYTWTLDYIYDAPQGYFHGEFPPGDYAVAAAFIAAPLSREEAGVGEDVILWPGVTGGGANADYEYVTLEAGETTTITFTLTDANGWACPWLYVADGDTFERRFEILRHLRGEDQEQTEITALGSVPDGAITIRIAEEKDEITYLDMFYLDIDGTAVYADNDLLAADDGDYLILQPGEVVDLHFVIPSTAITVSVVADGYYTPK
jgi:hypothetical protein